MKFIQRYKSPKHIGLGESVRYEGKDYLVLINYIVGETDKHGYTKKVNRTKLIDYNDRKFVVMLSTILSTKNDLSTLITAGVSSLVIELMLIEVRMVIFSKWGWFPRGINVNVLF